MEIKENSTQYGVQKRRMLEWWKVRFGEDTTYRNLAGIFERVGDQMLASLVHKLAQDQVQTDPHIQNFRKNTTLPTSLNDVDELKSLEIVSLLFHIANLSYIGILNRRSIFKEEEVESVLQHTNSSLLVVERMIVHKPTTYSFPHLTIQEFLAAFYFNTYLEQQEQKRALAEYSKQHIQHVFWKFCCGLKRNENEITFLEFSICCINPVIDHIFPITVLMKHDH